MTNRICLTREVDRQMIGPGEDRRRRATEKQGIHPMTDKLFSSDRFQPLPQKAGSWAKVVVWIVFLVLVVLLLIWRSQIVPPAQSSSVPLYEPGSRLDFTRADSQGYLVKGWHCLEPELQWSTDEGVLKFRLARVQPLRLRMRAMTFHTNQKVVVRLNDRDIGQLEGNTDWIQMELALPEDALQEVNTLILVLPEAVSPQRATGDPDDRTLGIGVAWMEFNALD